MDTLVVDQISDVCTAPDLAQCRQGGSCTAGEGCTIDVGFTDNVVTSMFVQAQFSPIISALCGYQWKWPDKHPHRDWPPCHTGIPVQLCLSIQHAHTFPCNLASNSLTILPEEMASLDKLTSVDVSNNYLDCNYVADLVSSEDCGTQNCLSDCSMIECN